MKILKRFQVSLLATYLEKWEKDEEAELVIIKVDAYSLIIYLIN